MNAPIFLDAVSKCYRIYRQPQDRFKQAFFDRWRRVLGAAPGAAGGAAHASDARDVAAPSAMARPRMSDVNGRMGNPP